MSKTIEKELQQHLQQYPNCTEHNCPHTQTYFTKVIFVQPDNGFIGTVQAFNIDQAKRVVREGIAKTHPHLIVKSIEVGL